MMKCLYAVSILLFLVSPCNAGGWDPDRNNKYHFKVQSEEAYKLTDSDREWVSTLVKTVEARGGVISHIRILPLLTEAQLLLNSSVSEYSAYAIEATNN